MTFDKILTEVIDLLQREGRISYRALKVRFQLDDEYIAAVKDELIAAKRLAADEEGKVLVWKDRLESRVQRPASQSTNLPDPRPQTLDPGRSDGERRQLTVMFCDLVGSTALSTQLDPEELREVVRTYQQICGEIIRRHEGYVAQYLGDGLLVYFGYPVAHEDDARQAVQAGLEIIEKLQSRARQQAVPLPLPHGRGSDFLPVRIGIHTGLVVVGEIGGGDRREQLALGETPNIAARVQGAAAPNTLIISAATARLVQKQADTLIALSAEYDFSQFVAHGTILKGWALADQGNLEEGITLMRQGLEAMRTTGAELSRPWFLALLAETYGKSGQFETGLEVLTEAVALVQQSGEHASEPELHRLRGEFLLGLQRVEGT